MVTNFAMQDPPPPVPPPKPGSHDPTRLNTPVTPLSPSTTPNQGAISAEGHDSSGWQPATRHDSIRTTSSSIDPGDQWLPGILQDKSKQELAEILASSKLLEALTHSVDTVQPSLADSHQALHAMLGENLRLAARLADLEARLTHQRSTTQAQLLSTHALERQWRQKQTDMDHALSPFAPAALYQRLGQGVHEQATVCHVMEESFLEGQADGAFASEREALDWVRRYREAKGLYYIRQERKNRWDEGRVGGWR